MKHIAVLDEGTTSTRAVLIAENGEVVAERSYKVDVYTPGGSRVEQDPKQIIDRSVQALKEVLDQAGEDHLEVECVAITNQRTNTTIMDRATGEPASVLIGWQDGRAMGRVEQLRDEWADRFVHTTSVNLAAANVALHAEAFLQDPGLRRRADAGELILGTPDTVLLRKLTGHAATSMSNASAYGAFDFRHETWWAEWLDFLGVPVDMFPELKRDDADFGVTDGGVLGHELPIACVMADQQSALFGHGAFGAGTVKCTHGTGSFIDFNVGDQIPQDNQGLDLRIGWRTAFGAANCIEGATWVSGSAIEWLIDDMKLIGGARELDATCREARPSGLIVVPALAGFASPHWDAAARGTAFGMNRHTSGADFVEATVTGVAHTVVDLLDAISEVSGTTTATLAVDGGLARSDYLQQMTADLLGVPVERTSNAGYVTAMGAAWIAGISRGVWASKEDAAASRGIEARFEPSMSDAERSARRDAWKDAVERSLNWRIQKGLHDEA